MKAFYLENPGKAVYNEIPLRDLEPDEILCKVHTVGICGTDLSFYSGETSFVTEGLVKYPVRIGHEWSGTVEACGSAVTGFNKGERIVADNGVACGKCDACKKGDYNNCIDIKSVGTINCWDGAFAQYIIMPARHVYHLPDSIDFETAAMIEPLTVAFAGMYDYKVSENASIAIIGTGPIGLSGIALAKSMGFKTIISIGRTDSKLEIAKKLGATHTVNIRKEELDASIEAICPGGAELVVETSGAPVTVGQSIDICARLGTVALIGFYEALLDGFNIDRLVSKALNVKGVMGRFGLVPQVIDYISKSGLDPLPMVTRRIDFDEVGEYFENHKEYKKQDIKVLVSMK